MVSHLLIFLYRLEFLQSLLRNHVLIMSNLWNPGTTPSFQVLMCASHTPVWSHRHRSAHPFYTIRKLQQLCSAEKTPNTQAKSKLLVRSLFWRPEDSPCQAMPGHLTEQDTAAPQQIHSSANYGVDSRQEAMTASPLEVFKARLHVALSNLV